MRFASELIAYRCDRFFVPSGDRQSASQRIQGISGCPRSSSRTHDQGLSVPEGDIQERVLDPYDIGVVSDESSVIVDYGVDGTYLLRRSRDTVQMLHYLLFVGNRDIESSDVVTSDDIL